MSVHKKLMQARLALQGKQLKKSGHNKFAGYQYFELGDFLPTVQQIFNELGLCGIVSYTADTASLTITDLEDSSNVVITSPMGSAALKGVHEVQNIGAVETYQRRYLWVTAMEIVEHDALDAVGGKNDQDRDVEPSRQAARPKLPVARPKSMQADELDSCCTALQECEDIDALKGIFGAAYKRADKEQQAILKGAYDKRKSELTQPMKEAA